MNLNNKIAYDNWKNWWRFKEFEEDTIQRRRKIQQIFLKFRKGSQFKGSKFPGEIL